MMLPVDFVTLVQQCAPHVSPVTMAAIVQTESGFNPYAIGVVRGRLERQPMSEAEAVATAGALAAGGWNFSVGLAQVNQANWATYGLNGQSAFDPCRNLAVGAAILEGCVRAARATHANGRHNAQTALQAGLSCYASGNFSTGFRTGYVQRIVDNARHRLPVSSQTVVPAIGPIPVVPLDRPVPMDRTPPPPARHWGLDPPDTASSTNEADPVGTAVVF